MSSFASTRGVALVITLLAISLLSAVGMGVALTASAGRLGAANHAESVLLLNAAESALALVARDLAAAADWTPALDGTTRAAMADAATPGVRVLADGTELNIGAMTNALTCGRSAPCSDARVRAITLERPWGAGNPRWQPYLYTRLDSVLAVRETSGVYVVAWLGDDPAEKDEDPLVDGGDAAASGRFAVIGRVDAFGARGARRGIEAGLQRVCTDVMDIATCRPGIRVQWWRTVSGTLP